MKSDRNRKNNQKRKTIVDQKCKTYDKKHSVDITPTLIFIKIKKT